jgi:protein-disulfide isomerase
VLKKYPKSVKLAFKHFPLRSHQYAKRAATAALAAERQGKFWEFQKLLFENYKKLNDQKIKEIAKQLALDLEQFEKDMADPKIPARINQDIKDGVEAGVRGTPTVFINGRRLKQRSLQGFQSMVEKELGK